MNFVCLLTNFKQTIVAPLLSAAQCLQNETTRFEMLFLDFLKRSCRFCMVAKYFLLTLRG